MSTTTSQASMDSGKWKRPSSGTRCQMRSGRPRSTVTNSMHITTAATAMPSPISTTSFTSWRLKMYAGITSITAAAATPTR